MNENGLGAEACELTSGTADLIMAAQNGGLRETEWRQLAAEKDVDPDDLLTRRLVLQFASDVIATAKGREALAQFRATERGHQNGRKLVVTDHAVERGIQRHRIAPDRLSATRFIRRDVREALSAGRIANNKPDWWPLLYGERTRQLPRGQRFLWNEARTRGFIMVREGDGEDVVLTYLHYVGGSSLDAG